MVNEYDILHASILIVDDLEFNVRVLDRMLRNAGYTSVSSTTNPLEVCALHQETGFDLILLDIEMPGMDGFQVMESLKEFESDSYLPVIVITGQPDYKLRALRLGAKDFISKPFELAEVLARSRNLLEVRLLHKESKKHSMDLEKSLREVEASREVILSQSAEVKRLYDQVMVEHRMSERLLLNVLPQAIVERLKGLSSIDSGQVIASRFSDVTVLFADIAQFTSFSAKMDPEKLVVLLDEIFTGFDNIAEKRGLEKIKTIGDAYMAVAGIPLPVDSHAERAALMALDMMDDLAAFNERNGCALKMRIGINSGAAVAGVIGRRKFSYDLWGDAVNIASRMESHGVAGRVQITDATRRLLGGQFLVEERGDIDVKGIGDMHTWFLTDWNGTAAE